MHSASLDIYLTLAQVLCTWIAEFRWEWLKELKGQKITAVQAKFKVSHAVSSESRWSPRSFPT